MQLFADFLKLELKKTCSDQYERIKGMSQNIAVRSFILSLRSPSSSDCKNVLDEETNERVQCHGSMLSTFRAEHQTWNIIQSNAVIRRSPEVQDAGKELCVGKGKYKGGTMPA